MPSKKKKTKKAKNNISVLRKNENEKIWGGKEKEKELKKMMIEKNKAKKKIAVLKNWRKQKNKKILKRIFQIWLE